MKGRAGEASGDLPAGRGGRAGAHAGIGLVPSTFLGRRRCRAGTGKGGVGAPALSPIRSVMLPAPALVARVSLSTISTRDKTEQPLAGHLDNEYHHFNNLRRAVGQANQDLTSWNRPDTAAKLAASGLIGFPVNSDLLRTRH